MMYIQLFLSFFQISLFSFGGGYAALPLIQGQVVNVHHWLSMTEFTGCKRLRRHRKPTP